MDIKNAKRIGIMGGAFDPIHHGHLAAAEAARQEMDFDLILFIPTGSPAHKSGVSFAEYRYLMTILATCDNPHFFVSRIEIDMPGPSYTVNTLRALKQISKAELTFIIGADENLMLHTWKDADQLPALCNWLTVSRPGYELAGEHLSIPGIDISGTELRKRAKSGRSLKYLIPEAAERFITDFKLYKDPPDQAIHQDVAFTLSAERYSHTQGVIKTAMQLALAHNINLRQTYLAALLHDYAKEIPDDDKHKLCTKFGITPDKIQSQHINIMHGQLSAELAKLKWNINDPTILDAIAYHTTGRAGMSPLEQIIKIADNTEPNRPPHPDLNNIKSLSRTNLRKAAAASIQRDLQYTTKKGHNLHPWGLEALEFLQD